MCPLLIQSMAGRVGHRLHPSNHIRLEFVEMFTILDCAATTPSDLHQQGSNPERQLRVQPVLLLTVQVNRQLLQISRHQTPTLQLHLPQSHTVRHAMKDRGQSWSQQHRAHKQQKQMVRLHQTIEMEPSHAATGMQTDLLIGPEVTEGHQHHAPLQDHMQSEKHLQLQAAPQISCLAHPVQQLRRQHQTTWTTTACCQSHACCHHHHRHPYQLPQAEV